MSNNNNRETIQLCLKSWDPTKILKNRRMIIVGTPGSGKTVAATDVMYHLTDLEVGIIMSPTDKYTGRWESFAPNIIIYDTYNSKAVKEVIDNQAALFQETYRQECERTQSFVNKDDIKIPPVFILCEDCMAENAMIKDPLITEIFMNGRHLQIFLLITVQWLMDMPINKRQLVDYLLVCAEDSPPALQRLYDCFFSSYIPTFQAFCELVSQATEEYGILVLDRTNKQSKKLEDHIFLWKAYNHPPKTFQLCSQEIWERSKTTQRALPPPINTNTNILFQKKNKYPSLLINNSSKRG